MVRNCRRILERNIADFNPLGINSTMANAKYNTKEFDFILKEDI